MAAVRLDKAFLLGAEGGGRPPYAAWDPGAEAAGWAPGWDFAGWNTSPDGSGVAVPAGGAFAPASDCTLWAQWSKAVASVAVHVYTYRDPSTGGYDYSAAFRQSDGREFATNAAVQTFEFSQRSGDMTLAVAAPAVFVYAGEGGQSFDVKLPDGSYERYQDGRRAYFGQAAAGVEVTFRAGAFRELYIHKMPQGRTLGVSGKYHARASNYGDGGALCGGGRYRIRWYDAVAFSPSGDYKTSASAFDRDADPDRCFFNIAHKGTAISHVMHAWVGFARETGGALRAWDEEASYEAGDRVVFALNAGTGVPPYDVVFECVQANTGRAPSITSRRYWAVRDDLAAIPSAGGQYMELSVTDLHSVDRSGLNKSPGTNTPADPTTLTNYHTCDFEPLVVDMTGLPATTRYYIGFGVRDDSTSCAGVKFRGTYDIEVI